MKRGSPESGGARFTKKTAKLSMIKNFIISLQKYNFFSSCAKNIFLLFEDFFENNKKGCCGGPITSPIIFNPAHIRFREF
mgnify:CR=1 FL=1